MCKGGRQLGRNTLTAYYKSETDIAVVNAHTDPVFKNFGKDLSIATAGRHIINPKVFNPS